MASKTLAADLQPLVNEKQADFLPLGDQSVGQSIGKGSVLKSGQPFSVLLNTTPEALGIDPEAESLTAALTSKANRLGIKLDKLDQADLTTLQSTLLQLATAPGPKPITIQSTKGPAGSGGGASLMGESSSGGTNFIFGTAKDDLIRGTAGIDVIYGFAGNDTVYAGAGADRIFGGAGSDVLFGEAGNDDLYGGTGDDTLDGGVGNDRLFGEAGNDILKGSRGNDLLDGSAGTDIADYSDLTQAITLKAKGEVLKGTLGTDTVKEVEIILGAQNRRNLIDNSTADPGISVDVNLGNNQLKVLGLPSGQPVSFQVIGFPDVNGTNAADTITGDDLANVLNGFGGNDTINAGGGNDTINGGDGNDLLNGDAGNDRFIGSTGNDTINGGDGVDILDYTSLGQAIGYTYTFENVNIAPPGGFGLVPVQRNIIGKGTAGSDTWTNAEVIRGAAGFSNSINFNFIQFPVRFSPIQFAAAPAIDVDLSANRLQFGDQTLTVENFTNVSGSYFNDRIVGNAQDNILDGYIGADQLTGGDGNDLLKTDESDTLTGGSGADRFQFKGAWYSSGGRFGFSFRPLNASTVTDFTTGSDQLVLGGGFGYPLSGESSASLAPFQGVSALPGTNQLDPAQFLTVTTMGSTLPEATRIIYNSTTGDLFYRSPFGFPFGSGGPVKFATLQGAPTLTASDIVLA